MKEEDYQQPYHDLMGDIIKKYEENGGNHNLPGKGKPISQDYFSGDTFQHFQRIANDSGYKPKWLNLQQEIQEDVLLLADLFEAYPTMKLEEQLAEINLKVSSYNRLCPGPLQKGPISLDSIKNVLKKRK